MLNLTSKTPKPLLKINNKILLGNTINFFQKIGFNEIFINTHFLHQNIESYINKNFSDHSINLIYEPLILGTGGGIKNIFNYTKNKKICVVNSDIFWLSCNKLDIENFLMDYNDITHCKVLLSKADNFYGLKNTNGDFNIQNGFISKWIKGNEILFYSGFQVVSRDIFELNQKVIPMNMIWDKLIKKQKLNGEVASSKIFHIGDKKSIDVFKSFSDLE